MQIGEKKILFIGAGNMGSAILQALPSCDLFFYEPNDEQANKIHAQRVTNIDSLSEVDIIFLCVKPQVFKTLQFPKWQKNTIIISIMAGVSIAALRKAFPNCENIVRTMPNIAIVTKKGTVAIATDDVEENVLQTVEFLFSECASTFRVLENQMDAVTGLSGSGPAFAFQFIDALAMGGVKMGLPHSTAMSLALSTVRGSTEMLEQSKQASELTASVCSPAGTTIAGIQELESKAFKGTVMAAVEAAAKRSAELGLLVVLTFFTTLFASDTYSQAQKLYSQGNFGEAAKMYASACPQLEAKEQKVCLFNEVKALVESRKAELVSSAEPKLLLLISQTEPSDSLFTKLSAEDAKLQIMLNNPVRAVRSWRAAQSSASPDFFSELFVLCNDIVSVFPENGLTAENCNRIKPADTNLISLPRNKLTPLSKQPAQQLAQTTTPPQNNAPPSQKQWYVQLGAFSSKENADRLVANFKSKGVELYVVELRDRKLFTVRTGFFSTSNDANVYAEQKIAPTHKDYKVFGN
ncbi:MAG: pyrroline-5-carboxylate reductase [Fibromonadaceae bacterium]|jgi:pyrroline-5-carboxylate reductase|nr:pyrroline-5-carboxylate reductase [Fibromonadaceae bacterium]